MKNFHVIIVGAGAAGLMCAHTAAARGCRVLVVEHTAKVGAKILISGGGRCNFTNLDVSTTNFISTNPHFAKSALSRYTPYDIMDFMAAGGATWHEKTLGQLFCNEGSGKVLSLLLEACQRFDVQIAKSLTVEAVSYKEGQYHLETAQGIFRAPQLVIATGGLSIPKMGATDFGYKIARQFGLKIVQPEPALVPFLFEEKLIAKTKGLAGVAAEVIVSAGGESFRENLLFTHRGLSGPAILQISSYWAHGDPVHINLLPDIASVFEWLKENRKTRAKASLKTILGGYLVERLADFVAAPYQGNMADFSDDTLKRIAESLGNWTVEPTGTEGFKKAEVTRGGVSTHELSSKTMEASRQKGLYFIGECIDVTGWLGGYNFQWAWASGHAAGTAVQPCLETVNFGNH